MSGVNQNTTFSGHLLGSANIDYANTAVAIVLAMTGDNSGYSGTFTLNGGSGIRALLLDSATAGSAAATWTVNAGNTLRVNGVAVELGTLNGAGTVTNSHASTGATISVGAGTFDGAIVDGTSGMALTKKSAGTLTLTGTGNTYTGATTVNEGTLVVSGSINGSVTTVNGGGTLGGIGSVKSVILNAGGAIAPGSGSGTLNTANGTFTWNGEASSAFAQAKFELSNTADLGLAATSDKIALGTGVLDQGTGCFYQFDFLNTGPRATPTRC